jgi:hypothetical protein
MWTTAEVENQWDGAMLGQDEQGNKLNIAENLKEGMHDRVPVANGVKFLESQLRQAHLKILTSWN